MEIDYSKNIMVSVLIALIIIIIFFVYKSNSFSLFNVVVNISNEGFYPNKISIIKGATVTWVNTGERLHWPASNSHPDHTLYPESGGCLGSKLDACRGLKVGEKYSFRFNEVGTWSMHDHLSPGLVMVVEVVSKEEYKLRSSFDDAQSFSSTTHFRNLDYGKQIDIINILAKNNPEEAWKYLKDSYIVNGQVVGNAHEFSHIIGNKSYEKYGINGIKICDKNFAFGCFHGVTEAMLLKEGLKGLKTIENECLKLFPPDKTHDYTSCIHGSGHGIYTWESGDLKKSLLDCDVISESYRQYCYDGVFMENLSSTKSSVFDVNNPWKFCNDLDVKYHLNCARYQIQRFLTDPSSTDSVGIVGKYCDMGTSSVLRDTCFESLGYFVSQQSLGNSSKILKSCKQIKSNPGMELCIIGATKENIFQKFVGFETSPDRLCNILPKEQKEVCINSAKYMINQYNSI